MLEIILEIIDGIADLWVNKVLSKIPCKHKNKRESKGRIRNNDKNTK